EYIGRGRGFQVEVVFNVIAANLQVANLAADNLDSTLLAVTDVVAMNVRLVQVDTIKQDAHTAVVVDVAIGNNHVAVPVGQRDAMAAPADQESAQRGLPGSFNAPTNRLGMTPDDFQALNGRQPFFLPDAWGEVRGQGRLAVAADQVQCRPRTSHQ